MGAGDGSWITRHFRKGLMKEHEPELFGAGHKKLGLRGASSPLVWIRMGVLFGDVKRGGGIGLSLRTFQRGFLGNV